MGYAATLLPFNLKWNAYIQANDSKFAFVLFPPDTHTTRTFEGYRMKSGIYNMFNIIYMFNI